MCIEKKRQYGFSLTGLKKCLATGYLDVFFYRSKSTGYFFLWLIGLTVCTATGVLGNDDTLFFSEIEVGNGDNTDEENSSQSQGLFNYFQFRGSLGYDLDYALSDQLSDFGFSRDESGVSKSKVSLNFSLKKQFEGGNYELGYKGFYDSEGFIESESEIREAFVNYNIYKDLWVKLGRQVVAWGVANFVQVTDIVNPTDQRELGLVDLEDARLPLNALRLSFARERMVTDLVLAFEFQPNRFNVANSDFDPFILLGPSRNELIEDEPKVGLSEPDVYARLFLSRPYGDFSFMVGQAYSRNPALDVQNLKLNYEKYTTFGFAGNYIINAWSFYLERAFKTGVAQIEDRFESVVGFEYSGFRNSQLSVEFFSDSENSNNDFVIGAASRSFFRELANLSLQVAAYRNEAYLTRLSYDFDVTDSTNILFGYINYASGSLDSPLSVFRANDRVYLNLNYYF